MLSGQRIILSIKLFSQKYLTISCSWLFELCKTDSGKRKTHLSLSFSAVNTKAKLAFDCGGTPALTNLSCMFANTGTFHFRLYGGLDIVTVIVSPRTYCIYFAIPIYIHEIFFDLKHQYDKYTHLYFLLLN